jgi:hypothetical protein
LEPGQIISTIWKWLKVAIIVAEKNDITLKSIVFPRNQYNGDYISVVNMESHPLGTEKSLIYKSSNSGEENYLKKHYAYRYHINITGYHCYGLDK